MPEDNSLRIIHLMIWVSSVGLAVAMVLGIINSLYNQRAAQKRQVTRCSQRGPLYKSILRSKGELAAEIDDLAREHNLNIANTVGVDSQGVLVAVNENASHLLIVGYALDELNRKDESIGVIRKLLTAQDIVSAEVVTEVRQHTTSVGGAFPFGDALSVLMIGSVNSTKICSVWLKVLVRDVKRPWIVFAMPDIGSAEVWRGIITLMVHQVSTGSQQPLKAQETFTEIAGVRERREAVERKRATLKSQEDEAWDAGAEECDLMPLPTAGR